MQNRPFDHGELNVPNRLRHLDRDLERHRRELERQERAERKRRTEEMKALREKAKVLLAEWEPRILERYGPKYGKRALSKMLRSDAYFNPEVPIRLCERMAREA